MGGGNPIKAITKPFKKLFKSIGKIFKSILNFVGDIIGFVLNPFGAFDTPDLGAQNADQAAQGVTVTKNGTNVAIPVVYGYRRVGGALIYAETGSTNNQYLWCAYSLCEGPIAGIKRIYIDDVALPLPDNIYTDQGVVDVTSGKFNGRIKFQVMYGNQAENFSVNGDLKGPNWGSKQRALPKVAWVMMRFYWKEIKTQEDQDNNPFGGGIPQVKFDILGKKVFDVRRYAGSVPAIVSSLTDETTHRYSYNPANCLLDYMLNTKYGAGLSYTQIDFDTFKTAALKFDQTVSYNNNYSGPAVTMNAVVDTNTKLLENLKRLLNGCRGIMPYIQGKYKLKVEDGGNDTDITSTTINVAFDVDKSYIIGGISLQGERKKTKFNEVLVNWIDPDREFTNQQQVYSESGDQALDNNEKLVGEFTFHTITNPAIAWETARMIYKKSRTQKSISFNATQELMNVEVGDIIRITDTVLNLSNDTFRIITLKLNNDLTLSIDAVEHDATLYPATGGIGQIEIPPQVYLPQELSVNPRLKNTPLNPLSVFPPNNPDEPVNGIDIVDSAGIPITDSAGATATDAINESNPLADEPDTNPTVVTKFNTFEYLQSQGDVPPACEFNPSRIENYTSKRYADGTLPNVFYWETPTGLKSYLSVSSDSGIFSVANLTNSEVGQDWVYSSAPSYEYPYGSGNQILQGFVSIANKPYVWVDTKNMWKFGGMRMYLILNRPQDASIAHYKLEYTYGDDVLPFITVRNLDINYPDSSYIRIDTYNRSATAKNIRFRWVKNYFNGGNAGIELLDGSNLPDSYTFYDYDLQKNVTGNNIEAMLNYYQQNLKSLYLQTVTGTGSTFKSDGAVVTTHSLGT